MQETDAPFRIDIDAAEQLIFDSMPALPAVHLPLDQAIGRVLRAPVTAERDQPPFDRATMDGIAVSGDALASGQTRFRVTGIQAAGIPQLQLADRNSCFEVMTGAVMPAGSDTVIPVERITVAEDTAELEAGYQAATGQFVHLRGSDHSDGELLLQRGTTIRGPEMAILTAAGKAEVAVNDWPSIAILSTGDELVDVGEDMLPHQIRSSNDRAIETALHLRGCTRTHRYRLPDDPDELRQSISQQHDDHDILILSGGVSMGKYDYIPRIMEELSVQLVFHKILQRPGLPMWFGTSTAGKPVFALPGNPVSTLVCLIRYVIPALMHSAGQEIRQLNVPLSKAVSFEPDLCWFLPVRLESSPQGLQAVPCPTNTSGDFIGLRDTDGFVELPRGSNHFPAGYCPRFWPW
jgi:molybdopterin molybdotransferase